MVDEINIEGTASEKKYANPFITTMIFEGKFDALFSNISNDIKVIRAVWATEYAINCHPNETEKFMKTINKNLSGRGNIWIVKNLKMMEAHYSSIEENPKIQEIITEQKRKKNRAF
jgi:hypothetical protein